MRKSIFGFVGLAAAAFVSSQAGAADIDNLLSGDFGDGFKITHVYSAADGTDHIEVINIPHTNSATASAGFINLLDLSAHKVTIQYRKDGDKTPFHYNGRRILVIELRGTNHLDIGDGKDYQITAGDMMINEDWTGRGHGGYCEAKTGQKICMGLTIDLGEVDKTYPLRP